MDDVSGSAWAVVRESEFLLRIFGRYPSFHDASVLSITMERACEAQILTSMLCLMTALFRRSASQLAAVAVSVVDRISRGELEMMEITAVFGAQVLASFASIKVGPAT